MGYPMTWQRIMGRNSLSDGGYDCAPTGFRVLCNKNPGDDDKSSIAQVRRQWLESLEHRAKQLAGDIRRMEHDARDEQSICKTIALRTGLAPDDIAAVLKEFFDL